MDLVETTFDEQQGWLRIDRGPMTIACNFAPKRRMVPVCAGRPRHVHLASCGEIEVNETSVGLPPESVVVLGPCDG
jgi:hypothetical protein